MKPIISLSIKVTLLVAAFTLVLIGIFYLKKNGVNKNVQRVLGIYPDNVGIKAKVIDYPVRMSPAPSQKANPKDLKSKDNY